MESIDQLVNAKWIITGDEKNPLLENQSLVIQNGLIKEIIATNLASKKYQAKSTESYSTIMPGLINTHTHLAMNYFRGMADDLSLMDWLNNHIWPAEKKWVSSEFVYDASLFAMAEMIRSGSTCFNDMYFFLADTAEAALTAGIRAVIGITVLEFPTQWAKDADEYLAKGMDFYQQYKSKPLITITLAPQGPYTVGDKNLLKIKNLAADHHLKINMHVHETADEIKMELEKTGQRPLKRLQKLGLLSPDFIAIHMTQINEEDLQILQDTKPNIVHCPESNMKLASGICPVEKLTAAGINIALGTDGAASNNDLDMISEMRSAAFLAKLATRDPRVLSASQVISLATHHGAKALGLDHVVGTLASGKSADFIAINLDEIETLPLYSPISQIVYAASRNQVSDVWVAGKQLMKNRKLLTIDEDELKAKVKYWQAKLTKT